MDIKREINVKVGSGIIGTYSRMPQKLERVFAEFIDNATQSYFDNKEELEKNESNYKNIIKIKWSSDEIVIEDNAFGMNFEQFERAMRLNAPASQYSNNSRSQFGMGLKIAAVYLGSFYSIESTQLHSKEKYYSEVDVQEWKNSNPEKILCTVSEEKEDTHYTRIIIRKLERKLTEQTKNTLKNKLASIYEKDLSEGNVQIIFNGQPIVKEDPILHKNSETGEDYLEIIDDNFEFNNISYNFNGWVGILETASTDNAGFTLFQYGRGIKFNFRPDVIFGKSNSYPYQRVVGEINLDGSEWKISFNKDEFIWDNGLEKEFVKALASNKAIKSIVKIANSWRKRKDSVPLVNSTFKNIEESKPDKNSFEGTKDTTNINKILNNPIITNNNIYEDVYEESVDFEGELYKFIIKFEEKYLNSNWIDIELKKDNTYDILIDTNNEFFEKQNKEFIKKIAISLALAQISSVKNGIDVYNSGIFLSQFNKILKRK